MTTTTIPNEIDFNCASTFFVDPGSVRNASEISISRVQLFFRSKPTSNNNSSGIHKPGVEIALCNLITNGTSEVPDSRNIIKNSISRKEWDDITVSANASIATNFDFALPPNVDTAKSYALLVKFDGNENYKLWKSVEGKVLVGTNSTTAGPAGKYIGQYYEYSNIASSSSSGTWKPLSTTDLKFAIYVAKYTPDLYANTSYVDPITGQTVINVITKKAFILEKKPYEFILYDRFSSNINSLLPGEYIWQNNIVQPTTISVLSGSRSVSSQNTNFASLLGNSNNEKFIVIYSGNEKNIRKVNTINSNNAITLDVPVNFTNAAAQFSLVAAAKIELTSTINLFGQIDDALVLMDSNANSSLRFVNNAIESYTINSGGTGYANTDYLIANGGGISGVPESEAVLNVITNGNGTITSLQYVSKGHGYVLPPTYVIKNANNTLSSGTGANVSLSVGSSLHTEFSNAVFSNSEVVNLPVNSVLLSAFDLENPIGTSFATKLHFLYYTPLDGILNVKVNNPGTGYANTDTVSFTGSGTGGAGTIITDSTGKILKVKIIDPGVGYETVPTVSITTSGGTGAILEAKLGASSTTANQEHITKLVEINDRSTIEESFMPVILSRSNEVTFTNTSIVTSTGTTINTNSSSIIEMTITSNNEFSTVDLISSNMDVYLERYAVNNDYEGEETGNGSAISKHISEVISFGDDRLAEDIRVFADIYRPANTDIKMYARIHNKKDPEAFVDKDWTLLEVKNNADAYSSPINKNDVIEFEYGFAYSPNTDFTSNGYVTTTANSANVVGVGTSFNTNFANGDSIIIKSSIFANSSMVAVINAVSNSTYLSLTEPVTNTSLIGEGFVIERIEFPHQAYNNRVNDNIVRYHGSSMETYDGYNTFAIKMVFLSENDIIVPKVENIRVIGVTA